MRYNYFTFLTIAQRQLSFFIASVQDTY